MIHRKDTKVGKQPGHSVTGWHVPELAKGVDRGQPRPSQVQGHATRWPPATPFTISVPSRHSGNYRGRAALRAICKAAVSMASSLTATAPLIGLAAW